MTYRVFSGPRGSQSISPLEKDLHLYKNSTCSTRRSIGRATSMTAAASLS